MEKGCLVDIKGKGAVMGSRALRKAHSEIGIVPSLPKVPGAGTWAAYLVFRNPMLFWRLAVEL